MTAIRGIGCSRNCESVFPEWLLDSPPEAVGERRWWAYYTKARQEKALAGNLMAMSIPYYLPLIPRTTSYGRSRTTRWLPLFPGYVFVFADDDERVQSLTTNRVSTSLYVPQPEILHRDLLRLKRVIESREPVTAEDRLAKGERVRVTRGALAGIEGMVMERRGQHRLLVSICFLQQGASVVIEQDWLEAIL
jgi:transcriptional antiterminator NusG